MTVILICNPFRCHHDPIPNDASHSGAERSASLTNKTRFSQEKLELSTIDLFKINLKIQSTNNEMTHIILRNAKIIFLKN